MGQQHRAQNHEVLVCRSLLHPPNCHHTRQETRSACHGERSAAHLDIVDDSVVPTRSGEARDPVAIIRGDQIPLAKFVTRHPTANGTPIPRTSKQAPTPLFIGGHLRSPLMIFQIGFCGSILESYGARGIDYFHSVTDPSIQRSETKLTGRARILRMKYHLCEIQGKGS